jgi:hypothetical protein
MAGVDLRMDGFFLEHLILQKNILIGVIVYSFFKIVYSFFKSVFLSMKYWDLINVKYNKIHNSFI